MGVHGNTAAAPNGVMEGGARKGGQACVDIGDGAIEADVVGEDVPVEVYGVHHSRAQRTCAELAGY